MTATLTSQAEYNGQIFALFKKDNDYIVPADELMKAREQIGLRLPNKDEEYCFFDEWFSSALSVGLRAGNEYYVFLEERVRCSIPECCGGGLIWETHGDALSVGARTPN